jgi:hypothetical protein
MPSSVTRFVAGAVAPSPATPVAVAVTLVGVGLLLQFSLPINHNVAWLLIATDRLLDGTGTYAQNVVEWNPPLILYLFAPSVGETQLRGEPHVRSPEIHADK